MIAAWQSNKTKWFKNNITYNSFALHSRLLLLRLSPVQHGSVKAALGIWDAGIFNAAEPRSWSGLPYWTAVFSRGLELADDGADGRSWARALSQVGRRLPSGLLASTPCTGYSGHDVARSRLGGRSGAAVDSANRFQRVYAARYAPCHGMHHTRETAAAFAPPRKNGAWAWIFIAWRGPLPASLRL
jgi:hypothetical protein